MVEVFGWLADFQGEGNWFMLTVLACLVTILARAVIWMFAHAFNMQEQERNSKAEIIQAFATIMLTVWLIYIIQSAEAMAIKDILGDASYVNCGASQIPVVKPDGATINGLEVVKCRIAEKAYPLADIQEKIYDKSADVFQLLSMYVSIAGVPVYQGSWNGSWFQEAENYRLLNALITTLLIGLNSIQVLIKYVSMNMLTIFLPFGLFLRSFHFTRGVGAFFIAIAIGLYFIFPIVFVLTDPGFVKVSSSQLGGPQIPTAKSCYPTFSGVVSAAASSPSGGGDSSAALPSMVALVKKTYTSLLLHPFVALSITLVFVRYLMYFFGGEPYELMRFMAKMV